MRCTKVFNSILLSTVLFTACGSYNTFPRERIKGIDDPVTLKALIDAGQTVGAGEYRIVDVRPEEKFSKGHIPTAMNIPNGNLQDVSQTPPENKMIVVYCETGGVAEIAARKMAGAGFDNIYNWGGFGNWTFETEK